MPTTPKQIPEITAIPTPTAGQETDIQTVVARESTYDTFKMSLAQIFTLATVSGAIKTALDGLSALIAGNTSSIASLGTTKLNKVGETRTGLTANRVIATNGSGQEITVGGSAGQVLGFGVGGAPQAVSPSVDIASLTQKIIPISADSTIISDSQDGDKNKRIFLSTLMGDFGGTGSDGALTISSGTTTIPFDASGFVEKNYSTLTITGGTLTFSGQPANGGIAIIKVKGDCTITGGAIDLSGKGGIGGVGNGGYGSQGLSWIAGISVTRAGGPRLTGGIGISKGTDIVYCGAGGGASENNTGQGGNGGGGIYIEVGGTLTFSMPATINVNGLAGTNGVSGGGGGAAGTILVKARNIASQTGTKSVNGGDGGSSSSGTSATGGSGGGSYSSGGNSIFGGGNNGQSNSFGTGGLAGANAGGNQFGGGGGAGFYKII